MELALKHLIKDPILNTLIGKVGTLPPISQDLDVHHALLKSIVSQQLSTKAAAKIFERFMGLNQEVLIPKKIVAFGIEELRSIGISYQKAGYIQNVSQYFLDHPHLLEDTRDMADEDLISSLTSIKGVGLWTVQMLMIFVLNRPDVLPLDDLIVRKGIIFHYGLDEQNKKVKAQCEQIAEQWRPYRSYASRYMWASKDQILGK